MVVGFIYLGYELIERIWLADVPMSRLHAYHRARGLLAALLTALAAAWLILRASPSLFTEEKERTSEPRDRTTYPDPNERRLHYARWFILMRWIAVVVASVLAFLSLRVFDYLPAPAGGPLLATIAALAALNLLYTHLVRRGRVAKGLLQAQAYGDLTALTVLLHFSGGVENPLANLMLFHVIIAAIILTRLQCYLLATTASLLFAGLVWAELAGIVRHYTLTIFPHHVHAGALMHAAHDPDYATSRTALQSVILFLTAYFGTTVIAQLRRGERQIERFADRVLAQSQLLERSLETTGTALCVCDRELRPSWRNRRWDALFGSCSGGSAGENDREALARRTLADGKTRVTEVEIRPTAAGGAASAPADSTFLVTAAPLVDMEGAVTHVVQLAREVTEQKRIQQSVVRTEKLAAVGELAGKVAHEVNNPMAIISAKARLLLSDHRAELSDRTAQELSKIVEQADRVARIAQGLLSYCRTAPGRAVPLDVRVPLRKALALVEPTMGSAGIILDERFPQTLPPVRADAGELEQVFLNLLVNALDAMPTGGRLTVSVASDASAAGDGRSLSVVLEDTGVGIPLEIQERVFEPFLTTKPEGKGTGLGLSICLGLVRGYGGAIELDSEPGRGTRVTVRLPTAESSAAEASAHG